MGLKRGFTYSKENQAPCEGCGKTFRTLAGLKGHQQFTGCGRGAGAAKVHGAQLSKISINDVTITIIKEAKVVKVTGVLKYQGGIAEEILAFWDKYSPKNTE